LQNYKIKNPPFTPSGKVRRLQLVASFISGNVDPAMKLLTKYLERAINLERLAASEQDSTFKTQLLDQAAAYRKLAAKRVKQYRPAASEPARNSN
jgi:hypothetical protein